MGSQVSTFQETNQKKRNMGSRVSTFQETNRSKKSRIIQFHSSAKWNSYFESSIETPTLIVVDFTAVWCGPCRMMEPAVNEFAARYTDVDFVKIDVDELMDVARDFGVQAMPTFILIKGGKIVDKIVGAKIDELQRKIEKHRV